MNIAISNIAWEASENDEILDVLRKHSVSAIEVAPSILFNNPSTVEADDAIRVRELWKRRGITIIAMQALLFGHPELVIFKDVQWREQTIGYLERIITLAGHLGVGPLVFGSPKNRKTDGLSLNKVREIAITFFRRVGQIALENNTVFCIEPNSTKYSCDFVTNTEEAVQLVRMVDHPGFRLHLDAGVLTMNGEPYETSLITALPFMEHFHISEPFLGRISDGKTDHAALGRIIQQLGYTGWLSIEMKSGLSEDNVAVVDSCLEFAKRHYSL